MRDKLERLASVVGQGNNPQIVAVGIIALMSFLIFYVLFQASSDQNYFREIIAALIGTLLTVTITTMLLKYQTSGEEVKERNVEVFRKKVEIYDEFLALAIDSINDNKIGEEEARELRKKVYHLSLFSSEETVELVVQFLRAHLLEDVDQIEIIDLVSAFRKDLNLEFVDELTGSGLSAVDHLLSAGFGRRSLLLKVKHLVDELYFRVWTRVTASGALEEPQGKDYVFLVAEGQLNSIAFEFTYRQTIRFVVTIEYPLNDDFSALETTLTLDVTDASKRVRSEADKVARSREFEYEDVNGLGKDFLPDKKFALKCKWTGEEELKIAGNAVLNAICEDVEAIIEVTESTKG
ncbi:hypothetical protein [Mesorhizobium sp. LSJC264A00]|nr:hypothetical protein [Mesorhizobium sp. LSJC264A00]